MEFLFLLVSSSIIGKHYTRFCHASDSLTSLILPNCTELQLYKTRRILLPLQLLARATWLACQCSTSTTNQTKKLPLTTRTPDDDGNDANWRLFKREKSTYGTKAEAEVEEGGGRSRVAPSVPPGISSMAGERYVALQIGFDAITSFNELITTVHKFNNDSFTFNDFISRALVGPALYCRAVRLLPGFDQAILLPLQKHEKLKYNNC